MPSVFGRDDTDVDEGPPQSDESAPSKQGTTRLRLGGLPFRTTYVHGEITIDRVGVDVPADKVKDVLAAGRKAGLQLEVVPK